MRIGRFSALALAALFGAVVLLASGGGRVTAAPTRHAAAPARLAATPARPAATPERRHKSHAPAPAHSLTRYSLVHGCFAISSGSTPIAPSDAPFRMQATALGQYLLYGMHEDFVDATLATVSTPSPATTWTVNGSAARGFTIVNAATGRSLPVTFTPATGCVYYPEAQVDATGPAFTGPSPEAAVQGTVEGHAHVTAFELFGGDWHCGRPWSPYGAPYALPASCAPDEQGTNGEVEAALDFGGNRPSAMHGWPTFVDWPSPTAIAEEGDYYTAIERAWKAGLRVMVTNLVDNEALCGLMTKRTNPCNDMASVHIQASDLYALQNYIDAQSGGPGKGWFRVVTDPFQARKVINQGKLAVIEGIEVSRIFGCGESYGVPQCNQAQVDAGLKEVYNLGVRTFFPVHEFDNAFGGSKMIAGDTGLLINAGNREETGSFFTLAPCSAQSQDAEQVAPPASGPFATLLNGPVSSLLHGSPVPVYGSGPQCNTRGLTDLGAYLVRQMIKQHFIIQLDHMDSKTADAALAIAQSEHYSGVVSAHCCSSAQLFGRIYSTGGFISEPVAPASAFVSIYKADKAQSSSKYAFGFGYGSDMNGLAEQPGPSNGAPVHYPFTSYDGKVTFTPEVWGDRSFNLNTDGLANYGMYADWLQSVEQAGGRSAVTDMMHGAESYLEMWERTSGVPAESCRLAHGRFYPNGMRQVKLGASFQRLLMVLGQPASRPGRSYRYCVARSRRSLSAVFTAKAKVGLWMTSARSWSADGIKPGQRAVRLRGRASAIGGGVFESRRLGRAGNRYVYRVRGGRITSVGIAARSVARTRRGLRAALRASGVR
jgi:hypothetical protein